MKKFLFLSSLIFCGPAHAAGYNPADIADQLAVEIAKTPANVVDFTETSCSVTIVQNGQTITSDSCKAHLVASNDGKTVLDFFFSNPSKNFTIIAEDGLSDSENDKFFFNSKKIAFSGGTYEATGACEAITKVSSTSCDVEAVDKSVQIKLKSTNAMPVFIKSGGTIITPGTPL